LFSHLPTPLEHTGRGARHGRRRARVEVRFESREHRALHGFEVMDDEVAQGAQPRTHLSRSTGAVEMTKRELHDAVLVDARTVGIEDLLFDAKMAGQRPYELVEGTFGARVRFHLVHQSEDVSVLRDDDVADALAHEGKLRLDAPSATLLCSC
jgi:hypothetical protein